MFRRFVLACCSAFCSLLLLLAGCSRSDNAVTRDREAQAKEKARAAADRLSRDAKKFGQEIKQDAHDLNQKLGTAISSTAPASSGTSQAEQKVARGTRDLRIEADQAGVKLNHAAIIAKVKAKLASDVGLSTVTGVDVDTSGQVVTLRGTVDSVQQKELAEQAAKQVSGVNRVIDDLKIRQ
jgi:osmotically-inducible protein OsmY